MNVKWKEFGLWLAFLFFCFGAGFLHGSLPEIQFRFFFEDPEKILIVTSDKDLISPELKSEFENIENVELQVIPVSSWEELRVKVVLSQGPHLLLIPQAWIKKLQREGRLRNINPLRSKIDRYVSEQFFSTSDDKIYFAPLYWIITSFATSTDSNFKDFNEALRNSNLKMIHLYDDKSAFEKRLQDSNWQSLKAKNRITFNDRISPLNEKIEDNHIYEWPLQITAQNKNLILLKNSPFAQLQVYGFSIPNNTPSRNLSLDIIEKFLKNEKFANAYKNQPYGSTLKKIEEESLEAVQKPSYLKDINLKDVFISEEE